MTTRRLIGFALLALTACSGGKDRGGAGGGDAAVPPGTFATTQLKGLVYPVRVASAADGMVYASDAGSDAVVGLRDGVPAVAITGVPRPLGVAVAGDLLYVGCAGRQAVEVYDLGQRRGVRTIPGVQMPNAIAVAADGTVYVADSKSDVIRVFDAQGAPIRTIGTSGTGDGQFRFPVSVAVDATRVVVGDKLNHRVQVFDRTGKFLRSFGGEVTSGASIDDYRGRFTSINSVALAGSDVYVLDSAHSLVQVLDDLGGAKGLLGYAGDCTACVKLALDIAVDADGRILATDPEHRRLVYLPTEMR
jgi:DNA-binding beta-propeller fold protein YncE